MTNSVVAANSVGAFSTLKALQDLHLEYSGVDCAWAQNPSGGGLAVSNPAALTCNS